MSENLRTFANKLLPRTDFFLNFPRRKVTGNNLLLPKGQKKLGVTDFVLERTCRASLANKASVSVSPKIVQLDL